MEISTVCILPEPPQHENQGISVFERGQCLVSIENDDDAVHFVVVPQAHLPELLELSARLGIRASMATSSPT